MKVYRKLLKFNLAFCLLLLFGCEEEGPEEYTFSGRALGTTYQIIYFNTEEVGLEKGLDSIFRVINKSMSTYQEDSDISRINAGDTTIVVDENFVEVYDYSAQIFLESGGYFDPTVGNLVNAYGFGSEDIKEVPEPALLDSLHQYVGFDKVTLNPDKTVSKEVPQVYLEFNAIAKGYAVDVIGRFLENRLVENYLIEVGGELLAGGINIRKQKPWVVAIDDPLQTGDNRTFKATIELRDRAMATSGNYRKFRVDSVTRNRFVHTINPVTGLSEKSNLLSATVLAENCTLADGYATAFMALGFEKSKEMLEKIKGVDVYFIYAEGNEEVKDYFTKGFEEVMLKE